MDNQQPAAKLRQLLAYARASIQESEQMIRASKQTIKTAKRLVQELREKLDKSSSGKQLGIKLIRDRD